MKIALKNNRLRSLKKKARERQSREATKVNDTNNDLKNSMLEHALE